MNRYLFDAKSKIMALVRPDGTVTFHNEMGLPAKDPTEMVGQESAVAMLQGLGFEEKAVS